MLKSPYFWIGLYCIIINIAGFSAMGIDKKRAKLRAYRIPERTLFLIAAVGGSIGSIAGMKYFRHKTKHKSFTIGIPLLFLFQIVLFAAFIIL